GEMLVLGNEFDAGAGSREQRGQGGQGEQRQPSTVNRQSTTNYQLPTTNTFYFNIG
ncbi:hypothetical protein IQ272_30960, partial [Chroococcidiopsidales cyanobacterium LEGE 13417]|nr:hypothetical protein [Chroococcidiopsidales cyanobacterium LEGE 13417]